MSRSCRIFSVLVSACHGFWPGWTGMDYGNDEMIQLPDDIAQCKQGAARPVLSRSLEIGKWPNWSSMWAVGPFELNSL